jgi:hypothetical protein
MIPLADVVYEGLLAILITPLSVAMDMFTPYRLASAYIDPFRKSIRNLNSSKTIVVGSSIGGVLAKVAAMQDGAKAIAVNSPAVHGWLLGDASKEAVKKSFNHNILIDGWKCPPYIGFEDGGTAEFVPYDEFPGRLAGTAGTVCLMAVQCDQLDYYRSYCEAALGNVTLNRLIKKSPYTIE